jgi:hypothetical protein
MVLENQIESAAVLLEKVQPSFRPDKRMLGEQRPTTTRITRSPIIKLLVDRHTRRIRPTAQTRIERCSSIIAVSAEP